MNISLWLQIIGLILSTFSAYKAGTVVGYTRGYTKGIAKFENMAQRHRKDLELATKANFDLET